jgi:hypothetical protein
MIKNILEHGRDITNGDSRETGNIGYTMLGGI